MSNHRHGFSCAQIEDELTFFMEQQSQALRRGNAWEEEAERLKAELTAARARIRELEEMTARLASVEYYAWKASNGY